MNEDLDRKLRTRVKDSIRRLRNVIIISGMTQEQAIELYKVIYDIYNYGYNHATSEYLFVELQKRKLF